ncbi:MAG: nucleotidyltransferase family protein [Acidobacteriota bacterium]
MSGALGHLRAEGLEHQPAQRVVRLPSFPAYGGQTTGGRPGPAGGMRWKWGREVTHNGAMVTLETLRLRKPEILNLAERHGARNIRVFGSVARGENREDSDIDFLVDLEEGRNLFDLGGFLMDLRDLLGPRVDLVTARSLHRYIRERVLAEAAPL